MTRLCQLWQVKKMYTTHYHYQTNSILECINQQLADFLRAMLLTRGQEEWEYGAPKSDEGKIHSTWQ